LREDGTVWAWGANTQGQLGDGTYRSRGSPAPVARLDGVAAIAAGTRFSLALKRDGTVWAWGTNAWGELGDGAEVGSPPPVQVGGRDGGAAMAAGSGYGRALRAGPPYLRAEDGGGRVAYADGWVAHPDSRASGASTHASDARRPGEASLAWQG